MAGTETTTKYIDYLNEDAQIPNQQWVCISFLSPEGIKNCNVRGIKIRGVYGSKEQADKRAEELSKIDPDFDVFVGEVGKWLGWNPDPNSAEDQVYQEKQLNDLMKGYKDNMEKAKRMQSQRKEDMIRKAAIEEQAQEGSKLDKQKARMRKKLDARMAEKQNNAGTLGNVDQLGALKDNVLSEFDEKEEVLKNKQTLANQERDRLNNNKKAIYQKEGELSDIDAQLAKIQSLYKELNAKKSTSN